jgi:N-acetylglucosaminyldiphosphoundecaprenol N-acetyl-beta-D-mannosaminyltransferase
MRRIGLEWIHRLAQEPRRLARRYLLEDMPFAVRLFGHVLVRRFKGKTTGESSDNPAA